MIKNSEKKNFEKIRIFFTIYFLFYIMELKWSFSLLIWWLIIAKKLLFIPTNFRFGILSTPTIVFQVLALLYVFIYLTLRAMYSVTLVGEKKWGSFWGGGLVFSGAFSSEHLHHYRTSNYIAKSIIISKRRTKYLIKSWEI